MYKPSLQLWYFSFQKQISNVSPEINNESLHGPPGPEKWGHDRCLSDHSNNRIMYMEISDCSQDLRNTNQKHYDIKFGKKNKFKQQRCSIHLSLPLGSGPTVGVV